MAKLELYQKNWPQAAYEVSKHAAIAVYRKAKNIFNSGAVYLATGPALLFMGTVIHDRNAIKLGFYFTLRGGFRAYHHLRLETRAATAQRIPFHRCALR